LGVEVRAGRRSGRNQQGYARKPGGDGRAGRDRQVQHQIAKLEERNANVEPASQQDRGETVDQRLLRPERDEDLIRHGRVVAQEEASQ